MSLAEPATHAEASRQRRDVASGEVMEEARLVRFVVAPDGELTPDLARRLPGRGAWCAATRAAVDQAVKRDAFSRALKVRCKPGPGLADRVQALLEARVLSALGLAKKAGVLICGFDKVEAALAAPGRVGWLVEAADGAVDGRRKLLAAARRSGAVPGLFAIFDSEALGVALGLENAVHCAVIAGRGARAWTEDVRRLEGFRPLVPFSWGEEP